MKILLADDHALFLEGLRNLLTVNGIQVIGTARNGLEAVERTLQLRPDIVLMDIRMPGCDGITATKLIKTEWPDCKIVMLTTSVEEPDLVEAIRSGANGYLLKTLEAGPFLTYLKGVERGEAAISRELAGTLLKVVSRQDETEKPGRNGAEKVQLTARQTEILQLVAQGFSNKEISRCLSVSEHTVKYHLGEIYQRLNLKNREQAVESARKNGLIRKT